MRPFENHRKSPRISLFQNLFLGEIEFHSNFVCGHLSPRILPVIFFAATPAKFLAGATFSPAPFFAGNVFFTGNSFRRTDPSCCPQKHQLGLAALFSKHASKTTPSYLYAPCRYMTITLAIACQPPIPISKFAA